MVAGKRRHDYSPNLLEFPSEYIYAYIHIDAYICIQIDTDIYGGVYACIYKTTDMP